MSGGQTTIRRLNSGWRNLLSQQAADDGSLPQTVATGYRQQTN
jgi:hypothetical protein